MTTFVAMKLNQKIAEKIAWLGEQRDVTQAEMARRTGFSTSAVSKWWRGEATPGLIEAAGIARSLKVPIEALLNPELELPPEQDGDELILVRTYRREAKRGLEIEDAVIRLHGSAPAIGDRELTLLDLAKDVGIEAAIDHLAALNAKPVSADTASKADTTDLIHANLERESAERDAVPTKRRGRTTRR